MKWYIKLALFFCKKHNIYHDFDNGYRFSIDFKILLGHKFVLKRNYFLMPPNHPNCRCSSIYNKQSNKIYNNKSIKKLSDSKLKEINKIIEMANQEGWERIDVYNFYMLSFKRDDTRINIYTTTMTVSTSLNHSLKGKTQLFRKHCHLDTIRDIFKNPRIHTNKGYYTK